MDIYHIEDFVCWTFCPFCPLDVWLRRTFCHMTLCHRTLCPQNVKLQLFSIHFFTAFLTRFFQKKIISLFKKNTKTHHYVYHYLGYRWPRPPAHHPLHRHHRRRYQCCGAATFWAAKLQAKNGGSGSIQAKKGGSGSGS